MGSYGYCIGKRDHDLQAVAAAGIKCKPFVCTRYFVICHAYMAHMAVELRQPGEHLIWSFIVK